MAEPTGVEVKKKRKIRSGGRLRSKNNRCRNFKKSDCWRIYHNNIRGYDSKQISLKAILSTVKPNVITLNETLYKGNKKLLIDGFKTYPRNRSGNSGGGIVTAVVSDENDNTVKVKEGEGNDEFIITRHSQFLTPVNIINVYGESECRTRNNEIEERFNRLLGEITKIESEGELVILIGDLNKHIGDLVQGNSSKVSYGGKLLRDFLEEKEYVLVNSMSKVIGGPFTRYDPSVPNRNDMKSCLDLIIISKSLCKYLKKIEIDKDFRFTAKRASNRSDLSLRSLCYNL